MMTQTHTLVAAALLTSPARSARQNGAILLGSFIPDIAVYGLFIWSKFAGIPERRIWREIYFSEPMLTYTAIANSLPLYLVILLIGILLARQNFNTEPVSAVAKSSNDHGYKKYWLLATSSILGLFAIAAITHLVGDFPVHAHDAHPHFWPFTDWRFHSPISYWDRRNYGDTFRYFEGVFGVILSIILFRRFKAKWVRVAAVIGVLAYVAVPLYFFLGLGR